MMRLMKSSPLGVLRQLRRLEHDDLAALGVAEVVNELVDQDPVVDVERVLHGGGRDVERLEHERPDQDGDKQRHTQEDR